MLSFFKKTQMVDAGQALPGRAAPVPTAQNHFVNGRPLKGPYPEDSETAILGLGCFWGAERKFWQAGEGVHVTAVGYAGGFTPNPTYEETCSGLTGHTEAVLVVFRPRVISYEDILKLFWESHNPTQGMRQGNDVGSQYRSAIYATSEAQLAAARASAERYGRELKAAGYGEITTEIAKAGPFYFAEAYHQQYLAKNPGGYCGLGGTGVSCPVGSRRQRRVSLEAGATRAAALDEIAARLNAAGLDDARREAACLLRAAAGLSAAALYAAPEAPLGAAAARVEDFARRRAAGEPLSRIEGRREFWGLDFAVTPDVLDPRADTETLVEAALAGFSARREAPLRVLDFGTGSGAILAALLTEWPQATGVGIDASPAAAATAQANLDALGLASRSRVRVGRWGEGLDGAFDAIVSNPPYIRSADIAGLAADVRDHDPHLALDGGGDGFDAYRALAPEIARLLAPQGRFFLEIGQGQGDEVSAILARAGLFVTERRADLGGIERVLGGGLRGEAAR